MGGTVLSDEAVGAKLCSYVVERLGSGLAPEDVERDLQDKGLRQEMAAAAVRAVVDAACDAAVREAGRVNVNRGLAWCIGGIAVTGLTYHFAKPGQAYIIAWGAFLFGALQLLRGLWQRFGPYPRSG